MLAIVLHFPVIGDLCSICSTATNLNSDMQIHVVWSEGMLLSVRAISGKSWKTNESTREVKKSTLSHELISLSLCAESYTLDQKHKSVYTGTKANS